MGLRECEHILSACHSAYLSEASCTVWQYLRQGLADSTFVAIYGGDYK